MSKTLFKSSEKSNFILNMTEDQYAKIASFTLFAACIATSAAAALPEFVDSMTYSVAATGLTVSGVLGLITAMIALLKKYVKGSIIFPAAAFAAMLGWGALSLSQSYDVNVGFYGFPQRGEGLLALIYYFGFFITAASLKREKAVRTLLYSVIAAGLLNALFALLQIFTEDFLFYSYKDISAYVMALTPPGLSQSPIFLAMVLCLAMAAALTVSASDEKKNLRIAASVSAALFAFVMVYTRTLMGICGIVIGALAGAAAVFITKKPKIRLLSVLAVIIAAAAGMIICGTVKSGSNDGYHLYDGHILWTDDAFQRVSASGHYQGQAVDIEDTYDVYTYLNDKTIKIIKKYPVEGTGPEQLVYPQIYTYGYLDENADITDITFYNSGTFDKVYNEYLYTAATRGIPSLIFMAVILLSALISGKKSVKKEHSEAAAGVLLITVCGVLVFFIGCSNITFSPILWACAGAACAKTVPGAAPEKPAKAAEKSE